MSDVKSSSQPKLTTYHLEHGTDAMDIEASDELTARALFNDRRECLKGKTPNPSEVTVTVVETAPAVEQLTE